MTDPIQTLRDTLTDSCIDSECRAINAAEHAEPDAMREAAETALTQVENLVEAMRRIADCVPNAGKLETQPVGIARAALAPFNDTP